MIDYIADVGANHDGSYARALDLIWRAAEAGATVVKFQHFRAAHIVSRDGFAWLPKMAHQAAWTDDVVTVYERASIPWDWTPVLAGQCRDSGVEFMSTPYDLEAVMHLDPYVKRWKIGSGDITYEALLRAVAITDKPVVLSTGASEWYEVVRAVELLMEFGRGDVTLLQCTTDYTGGGHSNIGALTQWRGAFLGYSYKRGVCKFLGLSDHTLGHVAACAAVALGATIIEKHFTDDRSRPGPDHCFAMEPAEWRAMVDACNATAACLGDGVKKVEPCEREARIVQRRAWWGTPEGWQALRPCPDDALTPMETPPTAVTVGDYARRR